jgi:hypothetical protein
MEKEYTKNSEECLGFGFMSLLLLPAFLQVLFLSEQYRHHVI